MTIFAPTFSLFALNRHNCPVIFNFHHHHHEHETVGQFLGAQMGRPIWHLELARSHCECRSACVPVYVWLPWVDILSRAFAYQCWREIVAIFHRSSIFSAIKLTRRVPMVKELENSNQSNLLPDLPASRNRSPAQPALVRSLRSPSANEPL